MDENGKNIVLEGERIRESINEEGKNWGEYTIETEGKYNDEK